WFNMVNDQNGRTETGTISGSKLIKLDIAGKYELRVFEMLGDANTVIAENQILVNKKPKAKLSSKTLECGKVEFMSESTNATNAIWNFDGKSFTGNNVEYSFKNEGYQKVMLVAQNEHCADTVVKEVYTLASMRSIENLELPNIFTPNADGDNDEWNVLLKNPQLKNVEGQIEVYSAQNELVFKSINGLSDKWNGKLMNVGRDCKQGMYRYIISFYNPCGNKESKIIKGLISIKR
ncbi:MAG: gliding motility-associated C-terminal domain-containing protein, partial [Bacteroidia bacterium]